MNSRGADLFGDVLLFLAEVPGLVVQALPVLRLLHAVDADQPVFRGERLLQVLQVDVLVADLGVPRAVESRRRAEIQLQRVAEYKEVHRDQLV